uniref:Uncharacterized protein n=1 Tax=Arundo donax TaxID=35708 RepID=A0A0A9EAI5_ARUDO
MHASNTSLTRERENKYREGSCLLLKKCFCSPVLK